MGYFQDKRVYITGGSSGIGKATARALVERGAHVMISARNASRLAEAVKELEGARVQSAQVVGSIEVDVASQEQVQGATAKILERLGGLDILVNNAGISHVGKISDTTPRDFERVLGINYLGTVYTTLSFLPTFQSQKSGSIVGVSSLLGLMGLFGYSAYAGSKFAIHGFLECLRQEMLAHGVHVSLVCPPDTDTPQWHEENKYKPHETKELAGKASLLKAEEVAASILAAVQNRSFLVVPGTESKVIIWAQHKAPWLVRWVMDRNLRKIWKAQQLLERPNIG